MADLEKFIKDMEKASEKLADMLNKKEEPIPDIDSKFSTETEALEDIHEIAEIDEENRVVVKNADTPDCGCDETQQDQATPQPCSRIVRFHCIENIPRGLRLDRVRDFRVVYDPTDLRVFVEEAEISVTPPPGCPDLTLTVFAVRVVGCIPVSISVLAFEGRCGVNLVPRQNRDDRVALCCHTTVCVDNVICYRGTRAQAEIAAAQIQEQLRSRGPCDVMVSELDEGNETNAQHKKDKRDPCNAVPLLFAIGRIFRVPVGSDNDDPRIIAFSGAFRLPSCPETNS
ncbi:hypothetical protein JT739_12670 [Tepidanaerobacter sp. GT38]|uniref:hypothetical protein n=1 Tax=Tepidanaerobacter sp. GT38 TaxID=2722793 RepID=UPI001F269A88|nr:hypothetical protein [Tepidanaerobacter sp. GT38]MCG1013433.1 hypothetical protein [Tepidanaerobacter sp. GT38]